MFRWLVLLALVTLPAACKHSRDRTVYVEVPTAGGLKKGSAVKFGGIDIGYVERLTVLRSGVRLELLIQRADAPLLAGDSVAVRSIGIFGDEAVVIVPGSGRNGPLRDRDTLHAAAPDSPTPIRDAYARAFVQEAAEQLHITLDSTKRGKTAKP